MQRFFAALAVLCVWHTFSVSEVEGLRFRRQLVASSGTSLSSFSDIMSTSTAVATMPTSTIGQQQIPINSSTNGDASSMSTTMAIVSTSTAAPQHTDLSTSSSSTSATTSTMTTPIPMGQLTSQQQQAINVILSLKSGARDALSSIDSRNYIQHNLAMPQGVSGYYRLQEIMSSDPATVVNPVRVFQDGDFVFMHVDYSPQVGFDVYRFQDGKIVEHWDNIQNVPTKPNGAGRTMLDGPSQPKDLDRTDANKAVVKSFIADVIQSQNASMAQLYIDTNRYIQHNPTASADGFQAALDVLSTLPPGSNPCSRLRRVLGQGDFVLSMCDGMVGANATAFYDLYRLENGKIVEHWDILEQIPPCSKWQNTNGKF